MQSFIVTCRSCHSSKTRGDICPVCTSGKREQTLLVRKSQPISLAHAHFFHGVTTGVSRSRANGDYR